MSSGPQVKMFPFPGGSGLSPETESLWIRLEPVGTPGIISALGGFTVLTSWA